MTEPRCVECQSNARTNFESVQVVLCPRSAAEIPSLLEAIWRSPLSVFPIVARDESEAQDFARWGSASGDGRDVPVIHDASDVPLVLQRLAQGEFRRRRHAPFAGFLRLSRALGTMQSEATLFQALLDAGVEQVGAVQGQVLMVNASGRPETAASHADVSEPPALSGAEDALVGRALETASPMLMCSRLPDWANSKDLLTEVNLTIEQEERLSGDFLVIPFAASGQGIGALCLKTHPARVCLSVDDIEAVSAMAAQVGAALERRLLFSRVEQGKKEWEATFDAIQDMVIIVRPDHTIARTNRATARAANRPFLDVIGQRCCSIVHGTADPLSDCPLDTVLRTAEPASAEITDRRGRILQLWMYPMLDADGNVHAVVEYAKDVTQYKQALARLMQAEKLSAIGELTAGVAHELNNPLTSILGFSQLLQMATEFGTIERGQIQTIGRESRRAARIVRNLLTFARRQEPAKVDVNVNQVVQDTLELTAYQLRVNGIAVKTELKADLPHTTMDPYQIQQVLVNLIGNAEYAMRDAHKGGTLTLRTRTVTRPRGYGHDSGMSLESEPGTETWIRIEVGDDGPGIPPDLASRIFDPFFTTKPAGKGTGLGLSVCHGIVRDHQGVIWVESLPGSGATFIIEVPVRASGETPQAEQAAVKAPAGAKPVRTLVVDDEESNLALLRQLLTPQGHQVDTAIDGEEALRLLGEHSYDLLLMDLRMPGMSGDALYAMVAKRWPEEAERVVFITGDTVSEQSQAFLEKAQRPVVEKPFQLDELRKVIQRVLVGREGAG